MIKFNTSINIVFFVPPIDAHLFPALRCGTDYRGLPSQCEDGLYIVLRNRKVRDVCDAAVCEEANNAHPADGGTQARKELRG
jgi:hypothetical protein